MRREHHINRLIPENCIFYAPLTQGDLTDHISGINASYGNHPNGSVEWDSNVGAYHFYKNGAGQACCWDGLNLGFDLTADNKVIDNILVELDIYSSVDPTGNNYWNGESCWRRALVFGAYATGTHNTYFLPIPWEIYSGSFIKTNQWQHISSKKVGQIVTCWIDDIQISAVAEKVSSNAGGLTPSYVSSKISVGKNDNSSRYIDVYLKNLKIFKE